MHSLQSPSAVVMIRPHAFASNPETSHDNAFQTLAQTSSQATSSTALQEHDEAVYQLRAAGITVHVFDDHGNLDTPDSVFPNNWFSTHPGGHVAIYPMFAPSRRRERRDDVIKLLKQEYRVQDVIDYSGLEQDNLALEGTGAMVLDHVGRIAYTVKSNRADPVLLERFCTHFNYEPIAFQAKDSAGRDVYHTNVLMGIGTKYALICLDMIPDQERRATVRARLEESGRKIVELSHAQIAEFAGNAIELNGKNGLVLALSSRALLSLTPEQLSIIENSARPLPLSVPTIETAGGSVRCMIAGIHLSRR
ncbi:citrulline utilization hydrolase CtlX [Ruegeria arenilitoris]|uniref:citrulline utilization hydrolase CtlX n=1 Tax=Ruegeria arenilitoris TaxID=1173585 RepID=UPI00147E1BD2|nr:arginine deiminase-related protein [Ruegeria arenilitoris]